MIMAVYLAISLLISAVHERLQPLASRWWSGSGDDRHRPRSRCRLERPPVRLHRRHRLAARQSVQQRLQHDPDADCGLSSWRCTVPPMIRWALCRRRSGTRRTARPAAPADRGGRLLGVHRREGCASSCSAGFPYAEQWRPLLVVVLFIGPASWRAATAGMWGRRLLLLWLAGLRRDRHADVGRRVRPALCRRPSYWSGLPLTLILADRRHGSSPSRSRSCLALGPALATAGGAHGLRRLYRAGARRAADHRAVHGVGDAAAVPAERLHDRQIAARPGRVHPVRRRLPRRGDPRRACRRSRRARSRRPTRSGLGYWRRTRLIVLPQALAMVIPPLVNNFHRRLQEHLAGA